MAKQKIDYKEFNSNKQELELIFNNINQILDDVESANSMIVSSEIWTGQAADSYMQKVKKVCDNFTDINYELKSVINYLNMVVESYQHFEKSIIGNIGN